MNFNLFKYFCCLAVVLVSFQPVSSQEEPEFSKAGFWEVENSGRTVYNFNLGWRFYLGENEQAFQQNFDDSSWDIVNCPNGLEYNSSEVSGSVNYQGVAWYRKHFTPSSTSKNKIVKLHFEAVMGKCKVWLNGELLGEHYGGYLPFEIDLTNKLNFEKDNVVVVMADNSDDPLYPPGKPQTRLDFSYFGGIYRDVWMVETGTVYVTNPNAVDKVAGGGIFTHIESISENKSVVSASIEIQNDGLKSNKIKADLILIDSEGEVVSKALKKVTIKANKSTKIKHTFSVENPKLWSPWSPDLYRLEVILKDDKGTRLDGVASRIGIRKIEFKGKDGFYLNNKPYPGKLIGVNRHQDHGYVGNAIPNNGQWRDAKIFKEGGSDIIRAAHYPADPAFMDACDELGLFYIEATPGWQFWNEENPIFEKRVYQDIRNMVRRDRNYASVIMWEPILNESRYPSYFAEKAHNVVHEEYPMQGAYTVCDKKADGQEHFDVVYAHDYNVDFLTEKRCTFTREFGDNVDDFNSQNSPSRVARAWGEQPQIVQAQYYADVDYVHTTLESLHAMPAQHVGGTLWAGFDHQRGYHCDPFYGGLADVFRQPKYSYQLFKSQRDISENNEPFIFVAHEMTPFSGADVSVYTNCDEVRLTLHQGLAVYQKKAHKTETELKLIKRGQPKLRIIKPIKKIPHPIVTFENVFDFMDTKYLHRGGGKSKSSILVEGLMDGKVVVSERKVAAKKPTRLQLKVQNSGLPLIANGSDFVLVVASMIDQDGVVKHLNENTVKFEVEGEGAIIGDASISANPKRLDWGTAPLLVRSTNKSGKIKIKASLLNEGKSTPLSGELIIESVPSENKFLFTEVGSEKTKTTTIKSQTELSIESLMKQNKELQKKLIDLKLKQEEKEQIEFDENH
ncbi:beta-galactosidase [Lutibacter oricola]|uniref:Beta-galactosidase n=1 Tax=Lutibacter oricola TaxID=762486 RepID=A0A1H2SFL7_9FLAO|nr:glycoside hydrolase family 2 TIM barrel-domain containing protein [Lutibacter oricola]SDW30392.1 beta-galactosidase [Lutibacter oricola]